MYDYTKRAPAPLESVVTDAWKYSTTSSSGQKVLAALKSYGLIEDAPGTNGKALKITQRAVRILLDDKDSPERLIEIRNAALAPKWYEFCWNAWGKEMPPSMRSNLLIEHGFIDTTVESFLRDYKKTIAFAGLLDDYIVSAIKDSEDQSNDKPARGSFVQWESQGVLRLPEAKVLSHYSADGNFAFVEGRATGIPVDELIAAESSDRGTLSGAKSDSSKLAVSPEMQIDTVNLSGGITIQCQWPSVLTPDAYDDFLYQFEFFKRKIGRAVEKKVNEETLRAVDADS